MATKITGRRYDRDTFSGEKDFHFGCEMKLGTDYIRRHAEELVEAIEEGYSMFEFLVCGVWYSIETSHNGVAVIWNSDDDPFGTWKTFDTVGDLCDWFDELAKKEA